MASILLEFNFRSSAAAQTIRTTITHPPTPDMPIWPNPGNPVWPTTQKQVVQQYGMANGSYRQYAVLASNPGDPVEAILGGRVETAAGSQVSVTTNDTIITYDNVTPIVTPGSAVTAGSVIGVAAGDIQICASMRGVSFDPVAMFFSGLSGLTQQRFQAHNVEQIFHDAAVTYGVDQRLLEAVAIEESGLDPRSISSAGAQGVMQLMPETARSQGVGDPYDFTQNVYGGARYLRELLNEVHGNVQDALAAYNAGPGAVEKYGGPPPYTQNYVNTVLALYRELGGR